MELAWSKAWPIGMLCRNRSRSLTGQLHVLLKLIDHGCGRGAGQLSLALRWERMGTGVMRSIIRERTSHCAHDHHSRWGLVGVVLAWLVRGRTHVGARLGLWNGTQLRVEGIIAGWRFVRRRRRCHRQALVSFTRKTSCHAVQSLGSGSWW